MADPAAVEDDPVREHRPLALREDRTDLRLDLLRVLLLGQLPAAHQSTEMGVHRDPRHTERIAEDHVGGLAAHSGQLHQVLDPAGHLPAEVVPQGLRQTEQGPRLGPEEPGRPDQLLQILGSGRGHVLGGRVGREEGRGRLVHPQVGGLGGQHRRDEQLEGIAEVELRMGVRIDLGQLAVDAPRPAHHGQVRFLFGRLRFLGRNFALWGGRSPPGRLHWDMFAHGRIWGLRHSGGPLGLCSHRLIGHPASLRPAADTRPDLR